jgi:Leucine rich repeat
MFFFFLRITKFVSSFLVIAQLFCFIPEATANKITCDEVIDHEWGYVKLQKTCWIEKTAVINSQGTRVSGERNELITGLWIAENKNVAFLPENVNEVFPNLVGYNADNCGVKTINKNNFVGLKKLKNLQLNNNPIEKIPNDAFEDLVSLEYFHFSEFCYQLLYC